MRVGKKKKRVFFFLTNQILFPTRERERNFSVFTRASSQTKLHTRETSQKKKEKRERGKNSLSSEKKSAARYTQR